MMVRRKRHTPTEILRMFLPLSMEERLLGPEMRTIQYLDPETLRVIREETKPILARRPEFAIVGAEAEPYVPPEVGPGGLSERKARRLAREAVARARAAALAQEPAAEVQAVLGGRAAPPVAQISAPPGQPVLAGSQFMTPAFPAAVAPQVVEPRSAGTAAPKEKPKDWEKQMKKWGTALSVLGQGLEAIQQRREPPPSARTVGGVTPIPIVPAGALYRPPAGFRSILAQYLR